jgi:4,5-DOPA dioxygenase extradiol
VIHDFGGFPEELYRLDYLATGDPLLAGRLGKALCADLDANRPLDHGAWVPLRWMFPAANIPVLQLSLPRPRDPLALLRLGEALRPFRDEGVLIIGSGGLVHNLGRLDWEGQDAPEPWAAEFEAWVMLGLDTLAPRELAANCTRAPHFSDAVPTSEHFDPLHVCLGAIEAGTPPETLFAGWQLRNLSLRCLKWD